MYLTYKSFDKITFPVYRLWSDNLSVDSKGIVSVDGRMIDDRNILKDSLGGRRLLSPLKGNFAKLNRVIPDEIALIQRGSGPYIDRKGKCFVYKKTKMVDLHYHRIHKVETRDTHSLIYLAGVPVAWEVPRPPPETHPFIGMLYLNKLPWKPYVYSTTKEKSTKRKI